ncbi:hypothetical protein RchiOBHm_Chr7g0196871 [Rosa chinensis]|uniref:Uncharacterized protein n=1 Tax=Rosa chinensis TaxID=74649 RepID=A0A2P6P6P8_ROSCH|nr:hypothetical protein RchiOBHm_Chr7g0196871 [Rosa chinensis]
MKGKFFFYKEPNSSSLEIGGWLQYLFADDFIMRLSNTYSAKLENGGSSLTIYDQ